jgi:4-hydroxymandelate oxidase
VPAGWLDSLEAQAGGVLPAAVHAYVSQGAGEGRSAAEAVAAWRSVRFEPHVLRDVTEVDLASSACGVPLAVPFGVAPTTLQRAAHPDGELATAEAVAAAGTLMVVSSNAGHRFSDIASTGVRWWLQAYLPQRRERARPMLDAAVLAGATAVVLTVDTPVVGTKHGAAGSVWDTVDARWLRTNLRAAADDPKATDLGPADIAWLGEVTGLPVVVKGVLRADDAVRCVEAGAAAVWVSNHGGRQLDRAAATARCLPQVVAAVRSAQFSAQSSAPSGGPSRAEVYVDGGLRNGLDLFAALSLGADVAFLGRQPFYALAVGGEAAVRRMLEELRDELAETMRLAGTPDLASVADVVADLVAPGMAP